eukprot:TRINITY_DN8853_c0_g2_i1.p1 TRINITY_DN8853_c0_g2~~TRINITY_DN8853_c0_g2_i1.p1  ORF type:complete len:189 (-),score=41.35 TRINITY_DN8853_c0_g2_i1:738-1304(-)
MGKESRLYVDGFDARDVRPDDLREMFGKYGQIVHIDYKEKYAFIVMSDGHDEAIRALDGEDIGGRGKRLRVTEARSTTTTREREMERLEKAENEPNQTLFIVNYETSSTTKRDIRKVFEQFGPIEDIEMKPKFCFLKFETLDGAIKAKTEMDGKKIGDREIKIQYRTGSRGTKFVAFYHYSVLMFWDS